MTNTAQSLFDAGVRVETLLYIPGAIADVEGTPEAFEDFCDDLPEKPDHPLYSQLPVLARFAEGNPETADVAETLMGYGGFLVQAAAPVRDYRGSGDGYSWSWGHYYTAWLYAPTEAEIASVSIAWAATMATKDKAKARQGEPVQ